MCKSIYNVCYSLGVFLYADYRWRLNYFKQHALFGFNYVHIVTCFAVYCIIPLRLFNFSLEWMFASLAYVSHGLIIFKYMMAIRYTYSSYGGGRERESMGEKRERERERERIQDVTATCNIISMQSYSQLCPHSSESIATRHFTVRCSVLCSSVCFWWWFLLCSAE